MNQKGQTLLLALLAMVLFSVQAKAQDSSWLYNPFDPVDSSTHGAFKVGLGYTTALNYYGRTDSLHSAGLYPSLEWDTRIGLYLSSNFVFVHNSQTSLQYAGTILEGGYKFSNQAKSFTGSIFADKFLYQDNADLVESVLKEQGGFTLGYLNNILDLNLGGNVKFSDEVDWGADAGLDHIIRFTQVFGKDVLVIDPSAYVFAGTQNFTTTYYEKIKLLILPIGQVPISGQARTFGILAWQVSLPVVLAIGKLALTLDPAYIIPENMIDNSGNNTGQGTGLWSTTFEATYSF